MESSYGQRRRRRDAPAMKTNAFATARNGILCSAFPQHHDKTKQKEFAGVNGYQGAAAEKDGRGSFWRFGVEFKTR